ncbi:hypothetical protein AAFF_G00018990 [Aldrovandia affinis]|uniref:Uncharacterized protein n=1 Tax=Aldrovandia affinis TaxID=143900 RepID=A0AAD7S5W7_9TELE|nr:hypothetical protein AAFF_G00018990 [Aldrovandia affinis]
MQTGEERESRQPRLRFQCWHRAPLTLPAQAADPETRDAAAPSATLSDARRLRRRSAGDATHTPCCRISGPTGLRLSR